MLNTSVTVLFITTRHRYAFFCKYNARSSMELVWKIVFYSILEIFHSIPFWHLIYSIPKFPFHSIPFSIPFHTMPWSLVTKKSRGAAATVAEKVAPLVKSAAVPITDYRRSQGGPREPGPPIKNTTNDKKLRQHSQAMLSCRFFQ